MRRRDFIKVIIGNAGVWPLAARAQQGDRMRHIAILMATADDAEGQARITALREGLQKLGWTEGPSLRIDYRWAAGEITDRIRALVKKGTSQNEPLDSNALIREIVALTRGETVKHGISIETQLADGLPPIEGDRIQLQQVILNLIINAIEAMSGTGEGLRELRISTAKAEADLVLVTVQDSGPGLAPVNLERLFEPFYTTKLDGQGMGLSICRSIIEAHRGPAVGGCERALRRRI